MKSQVFYNDFLNDRLPDAETFLCSMEHYRQFIMMYENAINVITMRLEMLKKECEAVGLHCPIRSISSRIKDIVSISKKLKKRGKELSIRSVLDNLNDVAGVRVICPYINDIYRIKEVFEHDEKIKVLEVRDYVQHPKVNGYRSLHLILYLPIPLVNGEQNVKCELQLRTTAMDSWASLEHNMRYKKNKSYNKEVDDKLKRCADMPFETDVLIQEIAKGMNVFTAN